MNSIVSRQDSDPDMDEALRRVRQQQPRPAARHQGDPGVAAALSALDAELETLAAAWTAVTR